MALRQIQLLRAPCLILRVNIPSQPSSSIIMLILIRSCAEHGSMAAYNLFVVLPNWVRTAASGHEVWEYSQPSPVNYIHPLHLSDIDFVQPNCIWCSSTGLSRMEEHLGTCFRFPSHKWFDEILIVLADAAKFQGFPVVSSLADRADKLLHGCSGCGLVDLVWRDFSILDWGHSESG